MKLRVLSDLHIEFHPFTIPPANDDASTILVLAGDVGVIQRQAELLTFLKQAAAQFRAVIYVLGNHEYYRGRWPDAHYTLRQAGLPDNVHLLERQWVRIDDIVFVGATLWTDFECADPDAMQRAHQALNDFRFIQMSDGSQLGPGFITPEAMLADHRASLDWLQLCLSRFQHEGLPCVLVTHHGLTLNSIHPQYQDNPLNGAFVSDCNELIASTQPLLAIHGHVHNSFDYVVGHGSKATRVLVNPRGYTQRDDTQENPEFDPYLTIALD